MDEIDAIGGRKFSEGTSTDREIQRTLMELLNQLDGFDELGKVCFFCRMLLTMISYVIWLLIVLWRNVFMSSDQSIVA
jgi:hypothetical protein